MAEIKKRIEPEQAILFALLFGSQASGDPRPDSDIDIGIYLDPSLMARERFELRRRLVAALDELGQADVIVLNDAPALLGHRALCGKKILVRDRTSYVRYAVRTLGSSGDERHWRQVHRQARARRLAEGEYGRP